MATVKRSKDIILYIGGKPVCAQKNIDLDRSVSALDITNKIDDSWQRNLAGVKSWKVNCGGVFIINDEAFTALETAFESGDAVEVKILEGETGYKGQAIITSFPIGIDYQDAMTYKLRLLGDGPLEVVIGE